MREIAEVIHGLTQSPPAVQQQLLRTFFTPDAAFRHPLCRVDGFDGSRDVIAHVYRMYKLLSPRIEIEVKSVGEHLLRSGTVSVSVSGSLLPRWRLAYLSCPQAFDQQALLLYVTAAQTFRIWFLPFHRADVALVTVLKLRRSASDPPLPGPGVLDPPPAIGKRPRYYIESQNDYYQPEQTVRFALPWLGVVPALVRFAQYLATLGCVVVAFFFMPRSSLGSFKTYFQKAVKEG